MRLLICDDHRLLLDALRSMAHMHEPMDMDAEIKELLEGNNAP